MPPVIARPLILLGILLLCHACYSAHEHSVLNSLSSRSSTTTPASAQVPDSKSLPLDISLETIFSVVLICVGLVSGAEELKPISWRVWAGQIEKEGGGGSPYQGLEERVGFVDIRAKRKKFADWVRSQDNNSKN